MLDTLADGLRWLRGYVPERCRLLFDGALLLVAFVAAFLAFSKGIPAILDWRERHVRRNKIVAGFDRAGIELSPHRPIRFFRPPELSVLDRTEYLALKAWSLAKRRDFEQEEITKVGSTSETEFLIAFFHVGDVRGIHSLPPQVRHHVHLQLTRELLDASGAVSAAIAMADAKLSSLGTNALASALFGDRACRRADLTPVPELTYFSRYFQPLMVAFNEDEFESSVGEGRPTQAEALLAHLKHLADHRVAACRIENATTCPDFGSIKERLPQAVPNSVGKRKERIRRMKHNTKDAALAAFLVVEPGLLDRGRLLEFNIGRHLHAVRADGVSYHQWTPIISDDQRARPYCFLWQCHDED